MKDMLRSLNSAPESMLLLEFPTFDFILFPVLFFPQQVLSQLRFVFFCFSLFHTYSFSAESGRDQGPIVVHPSEGSKDSLNRESPIVCCVWVVTIYSHASSDTAWSFSSFPNVSYFP